LAGLIADNHREVSQLADAATEGMSSTQASLARVDALLQRGS
jgi:hypothetical protein